MIERILTTVFVVVLVGAGAVYLLTVPQRLDAASLGNEALADAGNGERLFWAGGCSSCHAVSRAEGDEALRLGGGAPLTSDFGTFHGPNISPDPEDGIGDWSLADFANAMQRGVDPQGRHLYPAFPYTSYIKMQPQEVADLWAFMKTLPPVEGRAPDNDLAFPFSVRRGIGLWKLLYLGDDEPIVALPADASETVVAGRSMVEGPGHCGQCHTPRSLGGAGGLEHDRWLAGAPNPEGRGRIPNITPSDSGIGSWSASDLAYYFETGFTPDFDSVGGSMVAVQRNLARLRDEDRAAIAAYLKAVPALDSEAATPVQ
ncbi:MAG: cytochrome c [Aurantimonas endophytica]|uniref:Mono/diheme cytochrome c family protein n=1 Tax=Aurantimonas endophytica TaxID=1522175 RepID=A0A7W6MRF3_9HYPH|nr:mono/diheme cytochrome c family protein [Aurantimonas endophytica]MCO6405791.1 c-type cytochrome [Aurantimonas endophytica]